MNGIGNVLTVISRVNGGKMQDLNFTRGYLTMLKLSDSRKKFILELFAVLVVCAFLASSLVSLLGHSGTGANTKSIYNVQPIPFAPNNNNSSSAGYVKCTPVLLNNTLVNGNFINTERRSLHHMQALHQDRISQVAET